MKFSKDVTSSRRKNRKAYFTAPSGLRRIMMSAPLSKDLRQKYSVKTMPIRKNDEVKVVRGGYKGREGKIINVFRKKYVVHIDSVQREKSNASVVHIGVNASNCVITKLYLDNDRKATLARKERKVAVAKSA